jgi:hypothetical protein
LQPVLPEYFPVPYKFGQSLIGAYPNVSIVPFHDAVNGMITQAVSNVIGRKIISVVFVEGVPGPKPDISVPILNDVVNPVLG